MADKVVFSRGLSSKIPTTKEPGTFRIATDTGEMYLDDTSTSRVQIKDTTKVAISDSITNDEIDAICDQNLSGNEVLY